MTERHPRLAARSHVLVDALGLDSASVTLTSAVVHHLTRVLRLTAGDLITVTDGRGSWAPARVPSGDTDLYELDAASVLTPPRTPTLCVAFALTKNDKPDFTVQKLTECGIDRIVLLDAQRSVAKWDATRAQKHLAKLRLVAAEALMQSRGVWLPLLEGPLTVTQFSQTHDGAAPAYRADMVGDPFDQKISTIVIGPEGGWDATERALFPHAVSFSAQVLRAETAAIVAGGLMGAFRHAKSTHSAWL